MKFAIPAVAISVIIAQNWPAIQQFFVDNYESSKNWVEEKWPYIEDLIKSFI